APTSRLQATSPMLVTTMTNFGWSPIAYCGALVRPLTASVESGQSSPSLSTGGGCTAAVGVSGGWPASSPAGGSTWVLTSGFAPCAAGAGFLAAVEVLAPALPLRTATMIATTMAITTTATPIANPRRRQ